MKCAFEVLNRRGTTWDELKQAVISELEGVNPENPVDILRMLSLMKALANRVEDDIHTELLANQFGNEEIKKWCDELIDKDKAIRR